MTTPDEDATYVRNQQRLSAIRDELQDTRDNLRDDRTIHADHRDELDERDEEHLNDVEKASSESGSRLSY